MRFSERAGYRSLRDAIQLEGMDEPLRNSLWNVFSERFEVQFESSPYTNEGMWGDFYRAIWRDFWKRPIEEMPTETWKTRQAISQWFHGAEWFEIYDFIEYTTSAAGLGAVGQRLEVLYNTVLAREVAGYRIVSGLVTPISDERELSTIQEALTSTTNRGPLAPIHTHLQTALTMLADRKTPNYRNSVKESISAIEALARLITGDDRAELGKALKRLEPAITLHPALKTAFGALYGYSSDASGIRHALSGDDVVEFEDAKYMLVACSAFVHYLVVKADKAGVSLR